MALIRTAYWVGIVIDAITAVLLMVPDRQAALFGWSGYVRSPAGDSLAWTAASLMWGWTALLYWASRDPVARRGVLLLTVFPVLAGLMMTRALGAAQGLAPWFPAGLLQPALVMLFLAAYARAGAIAAAPRG